jgi:hypothetical protein
MVLAGCALLWAAILYAACVAAGRADDAQARALGLCEVCEGDGCGRCLSTGRRQPVALPEKVGRSDLPRVDAEALNETDAVWRAYPGLPYPQAKAVALRRLQERHAPGSLG